MIELFIHDLNNPHNVFFNHNNRLCFLEKNKFYCGDNIFYFNNDVFSVYEDIVKAGYWLCTKNNLIFINYFGEKINYIPIKESSTFKMIEIRGNLNETF